MQKLRLSVIANVTHTSILDSWRLMYGTHGKYIALYGKSEQWSGFQEGNTTEAKTLKIKVVLLFTAV